MQELFGLGYDYEHRNGTSLVLSRDDGIREDELSRIQTKMLQSAQVPGLLPFSVEHIDGHVRLIYDIGSRRMLQQALRAEPISAITALHLFVSALTMLEQCRSYMLRESGFVLLDTFLFVGADLTEISYVYLPISNLHAPPTAEQLERFIGEMMAYVPEEERSVLLPFKEYCRNSGFRVKELKRKLLEQLTVASVSAGEVSDAAPVSHDLLVWNDPLLDWSHDSAMDAANTSDIPNIMNAPEYVAHASQASHVLSRCMISIAFAAAGVIGCASLWNRWLQQPSDPMLHICIGVTLLTLAGWLIVHFIILNIRTKAAFLKLADRKKANPCLAGELSPQPAQPHKLSPPAPVAIPSVIRAPVDELHSAPIDPLQYYASLSKHTTMLRRPGDVTVLLQPAFSAANTAHVTAYLEIANENPPKRISIGKEPFTIGRGTQHTGYHLDGEGVSRQHVEIACENGCYAAKDLGSTNGTHLNGEAMVPYRIYELNDGDCISVVRTEVRFRFVENERKTV